MAFLSNYGAQGAGTDLARPRPMAPGPLNGGAAGAPMTRGRLSPAPAPMTPSPFSLSSPAGMTRPPDANPNASVPPVGPPIGGPAPSPTPGVVPGNPATWGQAGGGRALSMADQIENDRKTRGPRR